MFFSSKKKKKLMYAPDVLIVHVDSSQFPFMIELTTSCCDALDYISVHVVAWPLYMYSTQCVFWLPAGWLAGRLSRIKVVVLLIL